MKKIKTTWEEKVYQACFNAEMGADMVRFIKELLLLEYNRGWKDKAEQMLKMMKEPTKVDWYDKSKVKFK